MKSEIKNAKVAANQAVEDTQSLSCAEASYAFEQYYNTYWTRRILSYADKLFELHEMLPEYDEMLEMECLDVWKEQTKSKPFDFRKNYVMFIESNSYTYMIRITKDEDVTTLYCRQVADKDEYCSFRKDEVVNASIETLRKKDYKFGYEDWSQKGHVFKVSTDEFNKSSLSTSWSQLNHAIGYIDGVTQQN